ncbi:MAG: SRPBCC family protein [Myxococcota bacterium]
MRTTSTEILIDAEMTCVWSLLTEVSEWPHWGPSVRSVQLQSDRALGCGTRGRVQTAFGLWLPFEITNFEPLHFWDWRVAGVQATGHTVELAPDGRTRVIFTVPALFGPYRLVCKSGLRRLRSIAEARAASSPAGNA